MKTIKLLKPKFDKGKCVMEALHLRRSTREFSDRPLSLEDLSDILWAAYGINRPNGARTVPAAWGVYGLNIYAVLTDGVYLYSPADHTLQCVAEGDFRSLCGMQEFVASAPMQLLFFADYSRMHLDDARFEPMLREMLPVVSALDAGAGAQNVYLYCASEGIDVVERILINEEEFKQAVGLDENQRFIVAQTLGYPIHTQG